MLPLVQKGTLRQILASVAASLAGFNSGMWRVWPSLAIPFLKSDRSPFPVTKTDLSLIASLSYLSYFASPFLVKYIIRLGRKFCLLTSLLLFVLTWTGPSFATSPYIYFLSSISAGFGNGLSSLVLPLYIAEIAHSSIRGTLISAYVLFFTSGQIFTASIGFELSFHSLNLVGLSFSILCFSFAAMFLKETPQHHLIYGHDAKARESYRYFHGNSASKDGCECDESDPKGDTVDKDLEEMKKKILAEMSSKSSFRELISSKGSRRATLIVCLNSSLQMLAGTTCVIAFSSITLPPSGNFLTPDLTILICLVLGIISNSIGSYCIDKVGRKPLLALSSFVGFLVALSLATFYFISDKMDFDLRPYGLVAHILTMVYMTTYYAGMGIIRPVFIGELFPTNVKVHASMISILFLSASSFSINFFYLHVMGFVGVYAMFLFFAICNLLHFLSAIFVVIETKGKSLLEIQDLLKNL